MEIFLSALDTLWRVDVLLALLVGAVGGVIIGAIPGVGPAVAIAILLPALKLAREEARAAACGSNLRQAGIAIYAYVGDHDGRLPPYSYASGLGAYYQAPWWHQLIATYMGKNNPDTARSMARWQWRISMSEE